MASTIDALTPGDGQGDEEMAETVDKVLEQGFANHHQAMTHARQRLTETNDNVSEQTKLGFLESKLQVGTREAAANQRLDTNKLAQDILSQRSARDQPQTAGKPD